MTTHTLKVQLNSRGVLDVVLSRPDIRNAFNEDMISELTQVFGTQALDPKVRLVHLHGDGSVFSAGGDLNWMKKSISLTRDENLKDTRLLTEMFAIMNQCPKPVIGSIHGAAIGGGVGLVSVCDIAIATQETQFSLSEVKLGIVPACIGPFVIAKIGASHARALFSSAERFGASRALQIGLIHEIVQDEAALKLRVLKILDNMLDCGPQAMTAAKKLVLELSWPEKRQKQTDCLDYVATMLADLRVSPEGQDGLKAFIEKRQPNWIQK